MVCRLLRRTAIICLSLLFSFIRRVLEGFNSVYVALTINVELSLSAGGSFILDRDFLLILWNIVEELVLISLISSIYYLIIIWRPRCSRVRSTASMCLVKMEYYRRL